MCIGCPGKDLRFIIAARARLRYWRQSGRTHELAGFRLFARSVRLHIGAQDCIDAGLVAALLSKPGQQILIQSHGHNRFSRGPYDFGVFPELLIRGAHLRVGGNAVAYLGVGPVTQLAPVRTRAWLTFRRFASRSIARVAPTATPR